MFKRRWIWFGKLVSDEGFSLRYGNRSIIYTDERGSFAFGLEDGFLFPRPKQVSGKPTDLSQPEISEIVERTLRGIRHVGHAVQVYPS